MKVLETVMPFFRLFLVHVRLTCLYTGYSALKYHLYYHNPIRVSSQGATDCRG